MPTRSLLAAPLGGMGHLSGRGIGGGGCLPVSWLLFLCHGVLFSQLSTCDGVIFRGGGVGFF